MGFVLFAPFSIKRVYADSLGIITGDGVNVRSEASLASKVITSLNKNDRVVCVKLTGNWYRVRLSNGKEGWVYSKYIKVQPTVIVSREADMKRAYITSDGVNLRNDGSINAKVIATLKKGQPVSVKGQKNGWYNVVLADGRTGWVYGDYISLNGISSRGFESRLNGQSVVEYAKQFLGTRYVYGGTSPSGFDCSGFTSYVYKHFGITLPRVASDQGNYGVYVSKDDLEPGDLVFFATSGGRNITHVGIYIGDNQFIHSSSSRRGVIISKLEGYYSDTYVTARRCLSE